MMKYLITKSLFPRVRFIISNKVLVVKKKKKKLSPNIIFIIVKDDQINISKAFITYIVSILFFFPFCD